jgi:hypothetical protein
MLASESDGDLDSDDLNEEDSSEEEEEQPKVYTNS